MGFLVLFSLGVQFIFMIVTAVFAVILLGLTGWLSDVTICPSTLGGRFCGGVGVGITAGVLGMLLGILGILWLLLAGGCQGKE